VGIVNIIGIADHILAAVFIGDLGEVLFVYGLADERSDKVLLC
jgi:hypothetical protein